MLVLIDVDGTVADLMSGFRAEWTARGGSPLVPHEEHTTWDIFDIVPKNERKLVQEVFDSPRLFAKLPTINGAVIAVKEIAREHDVFFCTTPWYSNDTCCEDKLAWLAERFGKSMARKTIFTADKTLIRGDLLIDDKPEIKGLNPPSWIHVIFSQPYNAHITDKQHLSSWADWRKVL